MPIGISSMFPARIRHDKAGSQGTTFNLPAPGSSDPPLQSERRARIEEAKHWIEESRKLGGAGKWTEAAYDADKAVAIARDVLAGDSSALATVFDFAASMHEGAEEFSTARNLRREILTIRTKQLGKDDWQATDARLALENTSLLEKLNPAQRRKLTDADLLSDHVDSLYGEGEYKAAAELASRVAQTRREILGERHSKYATSLNNLAFLYVQMGDYARAEPLFQQALAIDKEMLGENHPGYATGLNNLGVLYKDMGEYGNAETAYQKALAIRKKVLGENDAGYAESLNNLALLYDRTGEYTKAEPLLRQALAIDRKVLGEKHAGYAADLHNLAGLYNDMGDYAKALPLYQQALEIDKQAIGERHPKYANLLSNLAELYHEMGDYAKAVPLYLSALKIRREALGEHHPDYATTLNDMAELYDEIGDYTKAELLYQKALTIRKEVLGERHPDYVRSLSDLASMYVHAGSYAKAEPIFQKVLAIRKEVLGERHPGYALSLNNLAVLYDHMGDYAKAEPLYRQALAIDKVMLGENHPDYANSLNNLAELYDEMGDDAKAEPLSAQASQIMQRQLDLSATVQSERQQLRMADSVRGNLDIQLSIAERANTPADDVYAQVLDWKGIVSARQQAMQRMRGALNLTHSPEISRLFDDLAATNRELSNESLVAPKSETVAAYQTKLAQLNERVEKLQQELATKSQEFRRQLAQRHRTPDDIRHALPAGTALVDLLEYRHYAPSTKGAQVVLQPRLAAFIVQPDKAVERIELGPVAPIAELITTWRKDFGMAGLGERADPGQELRRLVWEKLEPHLSGAKMVLISPDGVTARFPWLALPGKTPGSYLIEDTAIAVLPIPRLLPEALANKQQARNETPSLLLVGGVDFGADPGLAGGVAIDRGAARSDGPMHWPPLPGTLMEVAGVKATFERHYPQAVPLELTGAAATKQAVREQMTKCRNLHFSTHGFFAPAGIKSALNNNSRQTTLGFGDMLTWQDVVGFHPDLLSGLVLAGANHPVTDGKDDGILTAMEVSGLDLSQVDLATLSACETGLGESAGGEGLLGLQRAFQLAGAKTTVASLWQVPDAATQLLMQRFYDNLWNDDHKMSKLEALLEAQRWMLREGAKQQVSDARNRSGAGRTNGSLQHGAFTAFVLGRFRAERRLALTWPTISCGGPPGPA